MLLIYRVFAVAFPSADANIPSTMIVTRRRLNTFFFILICYWICPLGFLPVADAPTFFCQSRRFPAGPLCRRASSPSFLKAQKTEGRAHFTYPCLRNRFLCGIYKRQLDILRKGRYAPFRSDRIITCSATIVKPSLQILKKRFFCLLTPKAKTN